jgi:hypothetical protein
LVADHVAQGEEFIRVSKSSPSVHGRCHLPVLSVSILY